jgi:CDP-diacylglycerol--glycerol-3-phosphate 3-phosphatidyltransferase
MENSFILRTLRIKWGGTLLSSFALIYLFFQQAQVWWPFDDARQWFFLTSIVMAYFLFVLWKSLPIHHRENETELLATFGIGNLLTLVRAFLLAALAGFLFLPRPSGLYAWLPGAIYVLASLPDYVDGYFARITNHVTGMGEALDMNTDSVGVFVATLLAVQYGTIPWWYLPIGLARYLFLAGIWLRERMGKPIYEMHYSHRRRGFAALKMGFIFVILFPPFLAPGTHYAAAAFGIPFAVAFVWDWLIVSGRIPADSGDNWPRLKQWGLDWFPVILRVAIIVGVLPQIMQHWGQAAWQGVLWAEIILTVLVGLGVVGRTFSIGLLVVLGIIQYQTYPVPVTSLQYTLVFLYVFILMLGTGKFSLWPIEEWLVYNRIGDKEEGA